jgi:hypothetical protein
MCRFEGVGRAVKLSLLVVTTPARWAIFGPWCEWNISRQLRQPDEVVIVNDDRPIYVKRQAALDAAMYSAIAWFDDDDWHAPSRLRAGMELLEAASIVLAHSCVFYDLATGGSAWYNRAQRKKLHVASAAMVRTSLAQWERFEGTDNPLAAEVRWLDRLLARPRLGHRVVGRDVPELVALRHRRNTVPGRVECHEPFDPSWVEGWDDATREQLEALRNRLGVG